MKLGDKWKKREINRWNKKKMIYIQEAISLQKIKYYNMITKENWTMENNKETKEMADKHV